MGEQINKEFDEYQEHLKEKDKHLKMKVSFEADDTLEKELKELKDKEVVL